MKNISLKIVATVAGILGLMAVITGSRVLAGAFDPGYVTHNWLIIYNVFMGIVSLVAGVLIWEESPKAFFGTGLITVAHVSVLLLLLTVFSSVVAHQSIMAMIFRSVVWVVLFLVSKRQFGKHHL
jgi:hypothetical protein